MKDFIKNRPNFERVEFWAATTIFVFLVFFHISDTMNGSWAHDYRMRTGRLNFFVFTLAKYVVLYAAFLVMSFRVVPQLVEKKSVLANILLTILVIAIVATVFGVSRRYLRPDPFQRGNPFYYFQNSLLYAVWLTLVFGFYSTIKYFGIYVLSNMEQIKTKFPFVTQGGLIALLIWSITLLFMVVHNAPRDATAIWFIIPLTGILFYWLSLYKLIPAAHKKNKSFRFYLLWSFLILLASAVPVGIIAMIMTEDGDSSMGIGFFNFAFHFLITTPLAWIVFKRLSRGNEEIFQLQEKLGRSNANFDFLRSQINPHFLFNALNTIYGTAIQENAERTGEGIQKLGDMMRFMLQENMQDKIALTREIDYLENYISLQKLRTDTSPDIRIQSDVEHTVGNFQIPPMILIPFVENAFKHGISFREPSHIRIILEMKGKTLNFDVYNSKHDKKDNDPEKNKSGIGLKNVKQRLQLAYPHKHELIIRETQKEFFIHLTIQLS
jgi:two-component system, LytTR family, sensor kinase